MRGAARDDLMGSSDAEAKKDGGADLLEDETQEAGSEALACTGGMDGKGVWRIDHGDFGGLTLGDVWRGGKFVWAEQDRLGMGRERPNRFGTASGTASVERAGGLWLDPMESKSGIGEGKGSEPSGGRAVGGQAAGESAGALGIGACQYERDTAAGEDGACGGGVLGGIVEGPQRICNPGRIALVGAGNGAVGGVEEDLGGEIDGGENCCRREGRESCARVWGEATGAGVLARKEVGEREAEETEEDGSRR